MLEKHGPDRPHLPDRSSVVDMRIDGGPDDLPCPWCRAPTRENDPRCPTCGRRFG